MCGRTFCAIDPVCLQRSCKYVDPSSGEYICPDWVDAPTGESYRPSYNIGPTIFTPVLLSAAHHSSDKKGRRAIQPMRWGLIPQWHKGDRAAFKAMHNNCRGETISEKSTFSAPFNKGRRCVVIAEGFYEWKTVGSKKTPYLFTPKECKVETEENTDLVGVIKKEAVGGATEMKPVILENRTNDQPEETKPKTVTDDSDKVARPLLFMAGIFDVCKGQDGLLYSYSVITTEAVGAVAEIHHRMPVILESEKDINRWLNFQEFPSSKVKDLVTGRDCLKSHRVTDKVNNVRYQEADCHLPVADTNGNPSKLTKGDLRNWFVKPDTSQTLAKRTKRNSDTEEVVKADVKHMKRE